MGLCLKVTGSRLCLRYDGYIAEVALVGVDDIVFALPNMQGPYSAIQKNSAVMRLVARSWPK